MKTYPNISEIYPHRVGGKCRLCGKKDADSRMVIQISIFRGDDDVVLVHKECTKGNKSIVLAELIENGWRVS